MKTGLIRASLAVGSNIDRRATSPDTIATPSNNVDRIVGYQLFT